MGKKKRFKFFGQGGVRLTAPGVTRPHVFNKNTQVMSLRTLRHGRESKGRIE